MVVSFNMTQTNIDTYYSSVISLRSMRTVVFLAELNNIDTLTGYLGNAYLTARTTKILLNSVTNFATFGHAGHLIIINTALYGLNSSGSRFHS